MERTRLVLILMALCLAFAFSVSSVEAQEICDQLQFCDRDMDTFFKDHKRCEACPLFNDNIDCNDSVFGINSGVDEICGDGIDNNCDGVVDEECGDPEPDPEPNKGTPVIVTFDGVDTDSIQSDGHSYAHEESKTGILAILDGGFFMNMRAGGVRKLFINFGPLVDCGNGERNENDNPPFGDCVLDVIGPDPHLRDEIPFVECPFPSGLRTTRDGQPTDSCSALVKAALWEHDAFLGDPPEVLAHIEDMMPVDPNTSCDDRICGGPVMKVRPFQDRDIEFNVPSPTGKKFNGWSIIFSDKKGHCSDAADDAGLGSDFPDFLSIRALDVVGDGIADTWHIGTFVEDEDNLAGGTNDPRLACLIKHKRDEFVGFFSMSFMYTVVILEPAP